MEERYEDKHRRRESVEEVFRKCADRITRIANGEWEIGYRTVEDEYGHFWVEKVDR